MTREEYLNQRNELLAQAQACIESNDLDGYNAIEVQIKALDEKFEASAKAQANMAALRDAPVNVAVQSMQIDENGVAAVMAPAEKVNEDTIYLEAWGKAMMNMALTQDEQVVFDKYNAKNAVQTAETHGIIIPETVVANIWREAGEMYALVGDLDMTFVPGDLTLIKATEEGDDADWYNEATEVADGAVAFGNVNLTGCELAKNIPVSWKLKKMSITKFIPYITTLLAEKMGAALAKAVASGKGKPGGGDTFKPQPMGVETALEAETDTPQIVEFAASPTYDDITKLIAKLPAKYKKGAVMYANSDFVWTKLAQIKDTTGRPIFIANAAEGGIGRLLGFLVKEDDSVSADSMMMGNLKKGYAMNVNENATVYTEDHKKKRYTDYMAYSLVDGDLMTTKAFAILKKTVV